MIFLDNTGNRWKKIKFGTGLLSTTTLVPVAVLIGASLVYLPHWGSFELPKPISAVLSEVTQTKPTATPQAPKPTSRTATNSRSTSQSTTIPTSSGTTSQASAPLTTATSPTTTTSTTTTTTTNGQGQGLINQPTTTGNSDYGRTHQPIR